MGNLMMMNVNIPSLAMMWMVTFMRFPLNGTSRMESKSKVKNGSEYLSRIPMKMRVNIDGISLDENGGKWSKSHEDEVHHSCLDIICNPRMGSKSKVKNGSEYLSRILINIHPHFHGIPLDNDGCKSCSDKNGDGKYG